MEKGGEMKAMVDGDESWLMEDGDESWLMEDGDETLRGAASELVMCSICCCFVMRKKRSSIHDPGEDEVEVVMEAEKMRALTNAVLLHGPLQKMEPAHATKKQRRVLGKMRMIMMETKRCPACSLSLSEKPGPDEEDKAAGSKEKKKSSREEGSELKPVLRSQDWKEWKKMADARSVKKSKQSREDCNGSSRGLKKKAAGSSSGSKKKKAKSEDKDGSGSKKKAKGSSEMEGSGREVEMEGNRLKDVKMEVRESAGGNGKTKMVTRRLDKMSIDFILEECPPFKPYTYDTIDPIVESMFASDIAQYEVDLEFREYLSRQSSVRGYAEYQVEVTDAEDE